MTELAPKTKTLSEPSPAKRIVQAALREYVRAHLPADQRDQLKEEFTATLDGMEIRVDRDGWIVCEAPSSKEG